jgi:hypothetical protein
MSVDFHQTTWHYISEARTLNVVFYFDKQMLHCSDLQVIWNICDTKKIIFYLQYIEKSKEIVAYHFISHRKSV